MPYKNEHSCRINDPEKYDEFKRVNCAQKYKDKCIDVIYGIKNGKSEIQAYRYKTDIWTEEQAAQHCDLKGGQFHPAAKENEKEIKDIGKRVYQETQYRTFEIRREDIDKEKRTVALSFSSEIPVERWFGWEILDHKPESVRLSRINNSGAVLVNHNPNDQVGVVEGAEIGADRKGRAVVRFGKSARAEEIFQDILDGIRKNVSVGYMVYKMIKEKEDETGVYYRATDWEPMEISIVSVPADITVGVGRKKEEKNENNKKEGQVPEKTTNPVVEKREQQTSQAPQIDVNAEREKASKAERQRVAEILAIGEKHNCMDMAKKAVEEGTSREDFVAEVLEKKYGAKPVETPDPEIGMSEKEKRAYSFVKAIRAAISGKWDQAGLEREASKTVQEKLNREPRGSFFVPYDVLIAKRDFTTSTGTGSNLIATDLLAGSFIEMLRNRTMLLQLGAKTLSGLVGNVAIPKQSGGATMYWIGEGDTVTESNPTVAQLGLTPKTVAGLTDISRKLLQQSSIDVEEFVRNDIITGIKIAIDLAGIAGTGSSNQPTGILNTSGIGAVAIGTDGGAPTWTHIVNLWKEVAIDNADFGSTAYLTNAKVIGKLAVTEKATSTAKFIVEKFPGPDGITEIAGMRCGVSNQVPSNLSKGTGTNLSAIIFGNFADLIIAMWGGLDILVDPYTGSASGTVRIVVYQDIDIGIRHAESFAAIKDAVTT